MATSQKLELLNQTALAATTTNGLRLSCPPKSNNYIGRIQVRNGNAATTTTAKIQHSPDGTTWFDFLSFTAVVGATGDELKFPTTSMFDNVRATVALSGTTKLADVLIELYFDPKASA